MDLFSEDTRKQLASFIKGEAARIEYNHDIFVILEGNVKTLLQKKMINDLGQDSYEQAFTRQTPINVFRKIVDKQTRIYNREVVREVVGPRVTDADKELLKWYEEKLQIDEKMNSNNENYNAYLYSLLQIGLKDINPSTGMGTPFVRTIPNHQFLIFNSSESIDPTSADAVLICLGKKYSQKTKGETELFAVYTKDQYVIIDSAGDIDREQMALREQDGVNPYGVLPFTYVNGSNNLSMPMIQTDNKDLALLIPLLLTDLNFAVKFQAFAMFVAIDIEDAKISISPNSILKLKSDAKGEKPSFDAIKPSVDINDVLNLAASEMGLWLTTKGIRPGAIGNVGADTFASGVSKIIDESDSYESEKKQIKKYIPAEDDFWTRLLKDIHPVWVNGNRVENKHIMSEGSRVSTTFKTPTPMQTRGELVIDLGNEVDRGFVSKKRAIKKLNPDMSDEQIDMLINEIQIELTGGAE